MSLAREAPIDQRPVLDALSAYANKVEAVLLEKDALIANLRAERTQHEARIIAYDQVIGELSTLREQSQLQHRRWLQLRAKYEKVNGNCREWKRYAEKLERKLAGHHPEARSASVPGLRSCSKPGVVPPTQFIRAVHHSFHRPNTPELSEIVLNTAPAGVTHSLVASESDATSEPTSVTDHQTDYPLRSVEDQPLVVAAPVQQSVHGGIPRQDLEPVPNISSQATISDADVGPDFEQLPVETSSKTESSLQKSADHDGNHVRIKRELSSSPVRIIETGSIVPRQKSLDLDDVGRRVDTPRKRRRFAEGLWCATSRSQSRSRIGGQNTYAESIGEVLHSDGVASASNAGSFVIMDEAARSPIIKIEPTAGITSNSAASGNMCKLPNANDLTSLDRPNVLRPIASNQQRPFRTSPPRGVRLGSTKCPISEIEIPDGERPVHLDRIHSLKRKPHKFPGTPKGGDRLFALLAGNESGNTVHEAVATPFQSANIERKARTGGEWAFSRLKAFDAQKGGQVFADSTSNTPVQEGQQSRTPKGGLPTPDTVVRTCVPMQPVLETPSGKPKVKVEKRRLREKHVSTSFRDKPLAELRLDDFKVNPKASPRVNSVGSRVREERRHLPGCVDPACPQGCGQAIRALASELNPTLAISFLERGESDIGSDDIALDDEDRLLRWHLGATYYGPSIALLEAQERQELVLQAKTKLLAERHGRHRVHVARQRSPPGFWRTDMPSTQEFEQDREEARRLERVEVQNRWSEAMRDGGLWVFRDE